MMRRFLFDESGATSIEYALIAALASVMIIAALTAMADSMNSVYGKIITETQPAWNQN